MSVHSEVELPEGKTWEDVKSWYVRWSRLHVRFKDDTAFESDETDGIRLDNMDRRYPDRAVIVATDDDGCPSFVKVLSVQEKMEVA
jgi:hypothetical protein